MKRIVFLILAVAVAGCSDSTFELLEPETQAPRPDADLPVASAQTHPTDWIVVFRPGVADPPGLSRRLVEQAGGDLRFTYQHTVQGFAATLPPEALQGIRNNPNVLRVQPDIMVNLVAEETAASWGLDRVDERALPMDGLYTYEVDGSGVTAYILDTGIRTTHQEFGGRAIRSSEADFIGGTGDDCHGHGTHVAGTVGGATYGIAKNVTLQAVRVLDCNGSGAMSGVVAGVDWVTGQHLASGGPSVANMSLSAYDPLGFYPTLNDAVAASVDAGVLFAVAASNDDADACDYTPASEPQALTVGATNSSDVRASFSNYGYCLDLFAPGVGITSAVSSSDAATGTWSGTSMASPHVAGVAALYLSSDPGANPTTVKYHISTKATQGVVSDPGLGSPNMLLYSLITEANPPPPDSPPASPSDLVATAVSDTEIGLTWADHSADEDGFEIERSLDGVTFELLVTVNANTISYSNMNLSAETTYFYRVRAENVAGSSGYTNVAEATTNVTQPPPGDVVAGVAEVSDTEPLSQNTRFIYAAVGVYVTDNGRLGATPLGGVTVAGDWWWSGGTAPIESYSGVTDELGFLWVESGRTRVRDGETLHFCVTSLSGEGYVDGTTYPTCNGGFEPPEGGNPPDEPGDPQAPSNLHASWTSKGGGRVELTWTSGGGAEVVIFRGVAGGPFASIATTADNGKFNDRDGAPADVYQVCMLNATPTTAPELCSGEATAAAR